MSDFVKYANFVTQLTVWGMAVSILLNYNDVSGKCLSTSKQKRFYGTAVN